MQKVFLLIFLALASFPSSAQIKPDQILGNWINENKHIKLEILKFDNKYHGKMVGGNDIYADDGITLKKDSKNPDKTLKEQDLLDLQILTNFIFKDGEWLNGKYYDFKSGKSYSCILRLSGKHLLIRSYIGFSLFGRTTQWTRVDH
jgi:uncharacterized protein (DUF2147 family)